MCSAASALTYHALRRQVTGKGAVNVPLSLYTCQVLRGAGMVLPSFGSKAKSLYCLMRPGASLSMHHAHAHRSTTALH